ncbi:ester cyclase [Nocardia sp. CA-128927]|uniref:ester cyclase n=1 Tax=Nocardia sp. CA-128927 TaxID=3239975 RepID=UPI003D95749F
MDQETGERAANEFFDDVFGRFEDLVGEAAGRWVADEDRWREFVRRWVFDGYLRRDVDVLVSMVTDDFTNRDPLNLGHLVQGPGEFRRMLVDTFVAFPDTLFAAADLPYFGLAADMIVVPWRAMGTFTGPLAWGPPGKRKSFAPNGKRFDFTGIDTYTLRGPKVCAMQSFYDPIEVAQQLGLAPESSSLALRLAPYPQAIAAAVQRKRK